MYWKNWQHCWLYFHSLAPQSYSNQFYKVPPGDSGPAHVASRTTCTKLTRCIFFSIRRLNCFLDRAVFGTVSRPTSTPRSMSGESGRGCERENIRLVLKETGCERTSAGKEAPRVSQHDKKWNRQTEGVFKRCESQSEEWKAHTEASLTFMQKYLTHTHSKRSLCIFFLQCKSLGKECGKSGCGWSSVTHSHT